MSDRGTHFLLGDAPGHGPLCHRGHLWWQLRCVLGERDRTPGQGLPACDYRVDYRVIGDPAIGCGKDFVVEWRCSDGTDVYQAFAPPEAGYGAFVRMMCDETRRRAPANPGALVEVVSATHGGNCAAPRGNETADLARACSGKPECQYRIDYTIIGDPAVGCGKDYVAEWRCSGSRVTRQTKATPEAGYGAVITLRCAQP